MHSARPSIDHPLCYPEPILGGAQGRDWSALFGANTAPLFAKPLIVRDRTPVTARHSGCGKRRLCQAAAPSVTPLGPCPCPPSGGPRSPRIAGAEIEWLVFSGGDARPGTLRIGSTLRTRRGSATLAPADTARHASSGPPLQAMGRVSWRRTQSILFHALHGLKAGPRTFHTGTRPPDPERSGPRCTPLFQRSLLFGRGAVLNVPGGTAGVAKQAAWPMVPFRLRRRDVADRREQNPKRGDMRGPLSRAEHYRKLAVKYRELAKFAQPAYLGDFYRGIAVRYAFMAQEASERANKDGFTPERRVRPEPFSPQGQVEEVAIGVRKRREEVGGGTASTREPRKVRSAPPE
jgi:hypothetical protein